MLVQETLRQERLKRATMIMCALIESRYESSDGIGKVAARWERELEAEVDKLEARNGRC